MGVQFPPFAPRFNFSFHSSPFADPFPGPVDLVSRISLESVILTYLDLPGDLCNLYFSTNLNGVSLLPQQHRDRNLRDFRTDSAEEFPSDPVDPYSLVADQLRLVEQRLVDCTRSRECEITEIASRLITDGGKRIRPVVTLLTFNAFDGERDEDAVDIATAMELIHAATLLHDDIIDGAEFRRGKESAYKRYGLTRTLVTGDFLFIKAFEFAGKFDETVVQWTADACTSLTEGEFLQSSFNRNRTVTAQDYIRIVERKTASLFQTGAKLGAYIAGASSEQVEVAASFGLDLGIAFQMMDDVLDVVGRRDLLGKSTGMDLRDGNPSLPIILSLLDGQQTVARVFQSQTPTENDIQRALDAMGNGTVIERARGFSRKYAVAASREIDKLPVSAARDGLKTLGRLLTDRDS